MYNGHYFWVSRVAVVDRFDCILFISRSNLEDDRQAKSSLQYIFLIFVNCRIFLQIFFTLTLDQLVCGNVIIHTHLENTAPIHKIIALKVAHPPKHRSAKRRESQGACRVSVANETGTEKLSSSTIALQCLR